MPRPASAKSILQGLRKPIEEPKAPIASEMFLPNFSVVSGAKRLGTSGSVLFLNQDGKITTNSSELFWDNTNNRLGVGISSPNESIQVAGNVRCLINKAADGSAAAPSYTFNDSPTTGLYKGLTVGGELGFAVAGNKKLSLTNMNIKASTASIVAADVITMVTGDTTPSVALGNIFKTANSRPTTITDFDFNTEGQTIVIIANDNVTTIQDGNGVIHLNGSANFAMSSGDTLTLVRDDNTTWVETGRMVR